MKVVSGTPGRPTKMAVSEDTLSRIIEVLAVVVIWLVCGGGMLAIWNLGIVGAITLARPISLWQALLVTVLPFVATIPTGLVTALANDWSKNK